MFRNYLLITWRNLIRNRSYSAINLLGLALGLACVMLIGLWIQSELSMNRFHEKGNRLFRLWENQTYSNGFILSTISTPGPMAAKLQADFPEIERAVRVNWGTDKLVTLGSQSFNEEGYYADPGFFDIFTFPLLHGAVDEALKEPGKIAVSESLAHKYFGTDEVVGKILRIDNEQDYTINAVFRDPPATSTLDFDFLLPMSEYERDNPGFAEQWNNNSVQTYLLLSEGAMAAHLEAKIESFLRDNSDQGNTSLFLQAYPDTYLYTDYRDGKYQGGGRITYVRMFAAIGLFILLIACINFMNLSTARSATRAREVGIRRVSGAGRGLLVRQFLGESLLMSAIAGIIAIGVVQGVLPAFNRLFALQLSFNLLRPEVWLGIGTAVVVAGLLAGSYPAFFLSRFQPVDVFKGVIHTGKGAFWFRKGMVTAQFAISTFLIISTLVIYRQMEHVRNKNLGYQKENLLYFRADGAVPERYELLKAELEQLPAVEAVSSSFGLIYSWGNNTSGVSWPGKDPDKSILFQVIPIGFDFLETIGASLADGRDLSKANPADSVNFLINETAAALMGLDKPVGQRITVSGQEGEVVGLVRDFRVTSLRNNQDPVILGIAPGLRFVYLRLNADDIQQALADIGAVVGRHNPGYPFEFSFVDQQYEKMYRSEQRVSALSRLFAFISIFVSCLGLFGLAAFTAEQRNKEVSIRKVLGATVAQLSALLSREFLVLVLLGFALAIPVAWYLMRGWLENFASHVGLDWWVFGLSGLLAVLIALGTVSYHAVRTAVRNPAEALRSE
ncbi:MAG: ABC transporter permease [Phaeodactylibacter sp.]|nr:ABC transporter permease [Phaeodactylibacter sp.]